MLKKILEIFNKKNKASEVEEQKDIYFYEDVYIFSLPFSEINMDEKYRDIFSNEKRLQFIKNKIETKINRSLIFHDYLINAESNKTYHIFSTIDIRKNGDWIRPVLYEFYYEFKTGEKRYSYPVEEIDLGDTKISKIVIECLETN